MFLSGFQAAAPGSFPFSKSVNRLNWSAVSASLQPYCNYGTSIALLFRDCAKHTLRNSSGFSSENPGL
jgi:hypothetical protein